MTELRPRPGQPTPPIALDGGPAAVSRHLHHDPAPIPDGFLEALSAVCADVSVEAAQLGEASRDWWPLAMVWATNGEVGALAAALARPCTVEEVSAVVALCHRHCVPVTASGGRSSVVGGAVPVFGGVILDLCGLAGIASVDPTSMVVEVWAGTFGDGFEVELQAAHGLTVGHWPQSMALSTVGGWVACRGAGQFSNRYGEIEDMVIGLEVVLADGTVIRTGGQPRQSVGPDLNQVFLGSEGTLGVITRVWLQAHPVASHRRMAAYGFASFAEALDAMRRITQRGATPAVMRLYDPIESQRNHATPEGLNVLLVLDEGDATLVAAGMQVVAEECTDAAPLENSLVEHWLEKRNDVTALEALISKGYVVDTMEISGPWSKLPDIYEAATTAIGGVEGTLAVSAHQSHSYQTGACLYFTFAGLVDAGERDRFYTGAWDAGTRAVLDHGGSLSHHHGIGINRARFMSEALGSALPTLVALKSALDPSGVLNPGKLGLPSPFGPLTWPQD